MIERGTGRTSGLTDWQLMDVNSMWACLQDHDTANHWKQVAGWRKVCDLAQTHLGRLREYRRGLAEAWPPETSAASSTYLAELDELIDKVQRTHNAAAANYTALSAATQAIGTTRAALRKIHEEYATKFQQKQAYESMAADPKAVMGNRVTEAPVTDGELERLNVQARAAMFSLSSELQQAQATLQKPPAAPKSARQPDDPDVYGSYPAPVIPPIVPVPISTSTTTHARSAGPERMSPAPVIPGVGPVLGGATAGVPSAPTNTATPTIQTPGTVVPPAPAGPGLAPGIPPGLPIGSSTAPAARTNQPGALARPVNGGTDGGAARSTPPVRPAPSAGLIGGIPGLSTGPPTGNAGAPRRINPVGGVIGGGNAGTGPTGSAGSRPGGGRSINGSVGGFPIGGAPGLPGSAGRPGILAESEEKSRRWDPDNPWETDQGVPPVVQPPDRDDPIDPGPAIGFSR
ncbi:hypothetical protein [Micromonospora parathelypteridis]|uniref:PPE family domain-containing protein n=1 Tax=Micromonospora parathelypteridis TaxID=1839617 RepID=A0A840W1M3_9ACTN|nr:hypothetical protein [Micromonospora parathelypteridis]MBB5479078.1 hypothetical protein [Micromonospora parathelypteridis]GGO03147.1 hypothetical protein GCM10011576_03220 [Micromonospora parathelypteridis]